MTDNNTTREALPDAAEHVRRLAEDYADACVRAGYVTTINCKEWHKMSAAINALVEEMCAAIKAADDKAREGDYMLDSDDCIQVLRGTWNPEAAIKVSRQ